MFIPVKMTVQLEDGRIVEFNFDNAEEITVSSSVPLTDEEKSSLIFKSGVFCGGGNGALSQFD